MDFSNASFDVHMVDFRSASFLGTEVRFNEACLNAYVTFCDASFSGGTVVVIASSSPDCAVLLQRASVTGETVRLGTADAQAPSGLREAVRAVSPDAWPDPPF
ncbi:hypothetical protein ACPCDX_23765 [Streptomyces koyangensis]|uniref:hypothetical protein n=1 Tax=Streptomyces koyangensis TaxID=188770 RepID=UPI003C2B7336